MKKFLPVLLALGMAAANAANIVWVSDQLPIGSGTSDNDGGTNGVFGSGNGPYPDQGFITLLTGAGHTVSRFNPPNNTPLSAGDVAALNTYDLVIIGRSIGSGAFDSAAETLPWNTQITRPMLLTNAYLTRSSRLGWFAGATLPDVVNNVLTFSDLNSPVSQFIIGSTPMNGASTGSSVTEPVTYPNGEVDARGTSLITDPLVTGGRQIATSQGAANATFIAEWPAGTTLAGTSAGQVLSGYRMQFLAGNRESATAPNNTVGSAGFENLTADGERMFLRAVTLAANNGVVPEPGSASLLALGALGLLRRRRTA